MLAKVVRPDAKGRITLGQLAEGVSGYIVTETKDHQLILEPLAEIPAREKWLFDNKVALRQVELGLKDAKNGCVSHHGSFAQFLNDDE